MSNKIELAIVSIEKKLSAKFPLLYRRYLKENIKDNEPYEIEIYNGDFVYFYNCFDLEERNETYEVHIYAPEYFMIGQDGDLGYFIRLKSSDDKIYSLDLGALGSIPMEEAAQDIYSLIRT
ncbi:hypothetical protein VA7868_04548 [Vibrio aerogenes CECT 7868]|uniref:Knr4/Smi1-like domain-containing protein n=1 Tax=Vibrio aerogenes CECT 7868 TaxID=1216006 RepID=A0A1M6EYK0_9VIBR|nr:SMI1/KNR4 family protein [Vibrio aerogenes]SHI90490.1 hypothetical protein VA7868_04548 [Vibrio aerogenes CECT 7868]